MITQLSKKCKIKRLSNLDVSEFLVANNIKNENEPVTKACKQNDAGEKDPANALESFSKFPARPYSNDFKNAI